MDISGSSSKGDKGGASKKEPPPLVLKVNQVYANWWINLLLMRILCIFLNLSVKLHDADDEVEYGDLYCARRCLIKLMLFLKGLLEHTSAAQHKLSLPVQAERENEPRGPRLKILMQRNESYLKRKINKKKKSSIKFVLLTLLILDSRGGNMGWLAEPIPPTSSVTALRIPMIKEGPSVCTKKLSIVLTQEGRNNEKAVTIAFCKIPDRHLSVFMMLKMQNFMFATLIWGNWIDDGFDDLYNNLKVYEHELKGVSNSSSQNIAFLSTEIKGSTLKQNEIICSFFAQQASMSTTHDDEDLLQIDEDAMEEIDIRWQIDWTKEFDAEPVTFAMMALTELEEDDWSMEIDAEPVHFGQDGLGDFDWSKKADDTLVSLALMATNSEDLGLNRVRSKESDNSSGNTNSTESLYPNFQKAKGFPCHYLSYMGNPEEDLKDYAIIDSGCSGSTSNINQIGYLYLKDSPFHLEAFSDVTMLGDNMIASQTSGGCQYLGSRLVSLAMQVSNNCGYIHLQRQNNVAAAVVVLRVINSISSAGGKLIVSVLILRADKFSKGCSRYPIKVCSSLVFRTRYAGLPREIRRLKRQTISQATQIHKLKAKLKKLSKGVKPLVKHHILWVEIRSFKKEERSTKKKVSSVQIGGGNKDEGNLSEEHHDQDDHNHTAFVYEDFDATDADVVVTPDLERKSDETEQVIIEEEKDTSDVKSGDTKNWDLFFGEDSSMLDKVLLLQGL
ncbi:hypothetical protein Tco_0577689 [Tanacetum coccineum]